MKLVIVDVKLTEEDPEPEAKLDEGEHIVKRVVEVKDLWKTLEGESERSAILTPIESLRVLISACGRRNRLLGQGLYTRRSPLTHRHGTTLEQGTLPQLMYLESWKGSSKSVCSNFSNHSCKSSK